MNVRGLYPASSSQNDSRGHKYNRSILCRAVEGKTIGELRQLTAQQMLDWLEIPLTPRRMQCGLRAFKVLKGMIYSLGLTTGSESREPGEEQ